MTGIHILGGGPAGLAAGHFARRAGLPFLVHEATGEVGGNCRTFSEGPYRFDSGAHRVHDRDPEMTAEVARLLGPDLLEVSAPSFIHHRGRLLHFPLAPGDLFLRLDVGTLARALWSFAIDRWRVPAPSHFRDYAYRKYGRVLSELFLTNYSEKLWGLPAERLSLQVAGNRLKDLDLRALLKEAFCPGAKARHLEGRFYYPRHGYGQIAEALARSCGPESIRLNSRVIEVHHAGGRIHTLVDASGRRTEVGAAEVVSTLPLDRFVEALRPAAPDAVCQAAGRLGYRHLRLVACFLQQSSVHPAATLYFPEARFCFTRLYEPRNRSAELSPSGHTSLVAEIPHASGDAIDQMTEEALLERVRSDLLATGLVDGRKILGCTARRMPYAYPVLEAGMDPLLAQIRDYADTFSNLHFSGRGGRFVYAWTHNIMRFGKEIVEGILRARTVAVEERAA